MDGVPGCLFSSFAFKGAIRIKKYIIIAGAPRAGKSTVSKMISHMFGYQHISMDSIIAGLESTFPEIHMDSNNETQSNIALISRKIAPFIRAMIDSGEYEECDHGVVIDVFQLLPEDFIRYIGLSLCDIYYFVTSDISAEDRLKLLQKYDTPSDYTYHLSTNDKYNKCKKIVAISKVMKEQCLEFGLPCYETAHSRKRILEQITKNIQTND